MNERILIIEDDQDIAFIEKDYLEMSGYAITIASDGLTGLKEGLSGSYQLVLLDVMLPGDGFEVCCRLRDKVDIPYYDGDGQAGRYRQNPGTGIWRR